jgi:hypothetical protein
VLRKRGLDAEEIALKVGKSKAYVYARMKLLALGKESRAAFYDGRISASIALLLARISNPRLQKEALGEIADEDGSMSYRQAADWIEHNLMLRLDDAPFDAADEKLVRGATACGRCPKNTLASPSLFGDVKPGTAGVCTDPPCFRSKETATIKARLELAAGAGVKVIKGDEAKKVFPSHWNDSPCWGSGYFAPDAKCHEDPKHRTYQQLAGDIAKPVLVVNPHNGRPYELFATSDVKAAIKKQGISFEKERKAAQKAKSHEAKPDVDALYAAALFKAVFAVAPKKLARAELEQIAVSLYRQAWGGDELLYATLGWDVKKASKFSQNETLFAKQVKTLSDADLARLLFVLTSWNQVAEGETDGLEDLAKGLKVDAKAIRKQVKASLKKPDEKPAAKKKAKGKS